jgi:alkanesulfonate monooxygenase SsuD/methylene tetrahydromethanopterin reductase-like flavin-dependent oxidoreductase (luciferase family)
MKIGLMLPIGENEGGRPPPFGTLTEMALRAESDGLDSLWCADHLLFRTAGKPTRGIHEAWTTLSYLAGKTRRVELGPLVLAAGFRNPALTAKMAATLHEASGGRLILGLGCGWHEPEFGAFDYPFSHRVSRFDEALQIIAPLLRHGRVDFRGRFHSAPNAELAPSAPDPVPRLLVAGKRPRMLDLVARYADAWNTAWLAEPEMLPERLEPLHDTLREVGRDPETLDVTVGIFVAFPHLLTGDEELPERVISGDAASVGRVLAGYAEHRVAHLITHLWPRTIEAVAELARAAAIARDTVPAASR